MRRFSFLVLLFVVILPFCTAQNFLKNPGFESWSNGLPLLWKTDTLSSKNSIIAYSGTSALKFSHSELFGYPFLGGVSQDSIPVTGNSFSLKGWYQFYPDSGDGFNILVTINGKGGQLGNLVGAGAMEFTAKKTVYTAFQFGISMMTGATPETAFVSLYTLPDTGSGTLHRGTYALLDDFILDNTITSVEKNEFMLPQSYSLEQNYPNPFNPSTTIEFSLPKAQHVALKVYNTIGQMVAALVDEDLPQGRYRKKFTGAGLPSGIYFYEMRTSEFSQVNKMMLVK
jgi:hypothetical protein